MGKNPNFTVRFYVRTTKTQGGDSPTPLRVKVWVSDTKSYLYFSTNVTTTKRIWADFATDGTPSPSADLSLLKVVDAYKTATQLVMAAAIANERIENLTSDSLAIRVDALINLMKRQQEKKTHAPILSFTSPRNVPYCQECKHCASVCKAAWESPVLADSASDLALYNQDCSMRELKAGKYSMLDVVMAQVMRAKTAHPEVPSEYLFVKAFGDQMAQYAAALYKAKQTQEDEDYNNRLMEIMRAFTEVKTKGKEKHGK